jgi:hypothetical protein
VNKPKYSRLIDVAIAYGKQKGGTVHQQVDAAVDRLVRFGRLSDNSRLHGIVARRIW